MAELKTKPGTGDVIAFLKSIDSPVKREDSFKIMQLMAELSGEEPVLWGNSIIGFGNMHYKYESGREGDWFRVGFSPRKQNISLYLSIYGPVRSDFLNRLGKHKTGAACVYINKLADIDMTVLKEMITDSLEKNK